MEFQYKGDDNFELHLSGKFIQTCQEIEDYRRLAEINEYAILKKSNNDRVYEISRLSLANVIAKRHHLRSVMPSLEYFCTKTDMCQSEEEFKEFKSYLRIFENSFTTCFKSSPKNKKPRIKS